MADDLVAISKLMSFALRHEPEAIGLTLDAEGWAGIDDIVACINATPNAPYVDRVVIARVVASSDKQRFRMSDDGERVRASQGHSRPVDLGLTPRVPPDRLYHGTAHRFLAAILQQGLVPGSRQHVHLSGDIGTAERVGARHGRPVVLIVDCAGMLADGHRFYRADNGVWLTDAVPAAFLSELQV